MKIVLLFIRGVGGGHRRGVITSFALLVSMVGGIPIVIITSRTWLSLDTAGLFCAHTSLDIFAAFAFLVQARVVRLVHVRTGTLLPTMLDLWTVLLQTWLNNHTTLRLRIIHWSVYIYNFWMLVWLFRWCCCCCCCCCSNTLFIFPGFWWWRFFRCNFCRCWCYYSYMYIVNICRINRDWYMNSIFIIHSIDYVDGYSNFWIQRVLNVIIGRVWRRMWRCPTLVWLWYARRYCCCCCCGGITVGITMTCTTFVAVTVYNWWRTTHTTVLTLLLVMGVCGRDGQQRAQQQPCNSL